MERPSGMPGKLLTSSSSPSDYLKWKLNLKQNLDGQGLWEMINGSDEYEAIPEQADFNMWRIRNRKALHAIQKACGQDILPRIREIGSAKLAWDHLASLYTEDENSENKEHSSIKGRDLSSKTAIESNLLSSNNYKNWKSWMKKNLVEQNLWEIIDSWLFKPPTTLFEFSVWVIKNERALDAIKISCSQEMLFQIKEMDSAKAVWDLFEIIHPERPPCKTPPEIPVWREKLLRGIEESDWETIKGVIDNHPEVLTATLLPETGESILHLVADTLDLDILTKLVEIMSHEELEKKSSFGTALARVAMIGDVDIAKVLVVKNDRLLMIKSTNGNLPVVIAAICGKKEMVRYLYQLTPQDELMSADNNINAANLITYCIAADIFDVPQDILRRYPQLALAKDIHGCTTFNALSKKPLAFLSGYRHMRLRKFVVSDQFKMVAQTYELLVCICPEIVRLFTTQLPDTNLFAAVLQATRSGIVDYWAIILRMAPTLLTNYTAEGRSLLHEAVLSRQELIVQQLCYVPIGQQMALLVDTSRNNLLHFAGMLPVFTFQHGRVPGAALQMQLEVMWFQEVEKLVPPSYKDMVNNEGKTPNDVFTEHHRDLRKEGETWMKDTSQACTVVSTLIATVMLAATFTVPGGSSRDKGTPIFLKEMAFSVFIVSDGISLFSSLTSVMMFLAILTSRYAEKDFVRSLPQKLIVGLAFLFISIATMLTSFSATLFIVFHERSSWVIIPLTTLACVPVALFALLQLPLFLEMVFSTYKSGVYGTVFKSA